MSIIIGFDFGLARIGVAVGSLDSQHAQALTVLHAKKGQPDWNKVDALVKDWQPTLFVVGNPYLDNKRKPSNASSTFLSKKLLEFHKTLHVRFGLPIESIREDYSSNEAQHLLREQRQAWRTTKVRKGEIDMTAATVILQSWLSQALAENHQ